MNFTIYDVEAKITPRCIHVLTCYKQPNACNLSYFSCFLHQQGDLPTMSRVELAKIKSLIFYKDSYTAARRTSALPQLVCVGKPCKLFQPEVVRCVSLGGTGTEVDWKVSPFHS